MVSALVRGNAYSQRMAKLRRIWLRKFITVEILTYVLSVGEDQPYEDFTEIHWYKLSTHRSFASYMPCGQSTAIPLSLPGIQCGLGHCVPCNLVHSTLSHSDRMPGRKRRSTGLI